MEVLTNAFRYLVKEDRKKMIDNNEYPTSFIILDKNLDINNDDIFNSLTLEDNIEICVISKKENLIIIKIRDEFVMIRVEDIDGKPRNIRMIKYRYEYQKGDVINWIS